MGADGEWSYHVLIMEPRSAGHIIKKFLEGDDKVFKVFVIYQHSYKVSYKTLIIL